MNVRVIVVCAFTITASMSGCSTMNQKVHHDCLVYVKEQRMKVEGDPPATRYQRLVSTSCGVFEVSDSIAGGWKSYDRWAQIKEDRRYDITTGGFRLPWIFPDVIDIKAVTP